MRFVKFEIKNFKGIKELVLELDKQPRTKIFTLIGLNESGKTSILEAINLFQNDVPASDRHTLIPKGEKISFSGNIEVIATLELNDSDNDKINAFAKSLGIMQMENPKYIRVTKYYTFINSSFENSSSSWLYNPDVTLKKSKKSLKLVSKEEEWQSIVKFIKANLFPKIVYYPNFLFDFPEKIYIDEAADASTEKRTYKNVVQDILSTIREGFTIEEQLISRIEKSDRSSKEALENTLSRMSALVTQLVFAAWEKLFSRGNKAIEIYYGQETEIITKTSPLGSAYNTKEEFERYYLEFKLREGANKFYIHERSLGFKWFFTFLLFTEFRKHRSTDSGEILFLLDEPASNLHSTAQKKLLQTFEGLIDKSILVYTTHSHHLINPEWLSGAYIVRNRALKYTNEFDYDVNLTDIEALQYKQFVATHPDQPDYFQPILDTLDYQPGLLEKIPNIITTEGKNDFYTFKYISELYFEDEYVSLNFYPGTGADTNTQVISLYLAWNRPILILLDGDRKGETAKKTYIHKFGSIVEDIICNLGDIDSLYSGLAVEGLFTDDERLKITQQFDNKLKAYDKGKFNTAIQTLLFEKQKINLSQGTLSNFKKIFNFLKDKLQRESN